MEEGERFSTFNGTIFLIFEREAPHLHLALGPAPQGASPALHCSPFLLEPPSFSSL